jgi:uncharacterized protein
MDIPNSTALVTGGSGGIGLELARVLARNGFDIVLVARDQQKLLRAVEDLRGVANINITAFPKDLALPSAPGEIYDQLARQNIRIDILINNAGFGQYGRFDESDLARQLEMIQVNMTALTNLTGLFVKDMVRSGYGRILNVASTAAFQPGPLMSVYYASKAYVLFFSEALAYELRGTGVTVTTLCPGATRTGFQGVAGIKESRLIKSGRIMSAEKVAIAGYKGMMQGKRVVVPGLLNILLTCSVRFIPRSLLLPAVGWVQEVRQKGSNKSA